MKVKKTSRTLQQGWKNTFYKCIVFKDVWFKHTSVKFFSREGVLVWRGKEAKGDFAQVVCLPAWSLKINQNTAAQTYRQSEYELAVAAQKQHSSWLVTFSWMLLMIWIHWLYMLLLDGGNTSTAQSRTSRKRICICRGQGLCIYCHADLVGHKWWLKGIIFVWVCKLF